jgi:hypothetical protein
VGLLRIREPGAECPALLDGEGLFLDLSAVVLDIGGSLLLVDGGLDEARGLRLNCLTTRKSPITTSRCCS